MQYRKLGKWGVKLSAIGLGSYLTIGYKLDKKDSAAMVAKAHDNGVNFIDTADAYAKGAAEEVLGDILRDYKRNTIFLLTKCFAAMSDDVNDRGLSAKHVFESCHASLKRLKTDYLDVLMCHRPDPDTPLEETIRAFEDLARQGKILYWGVSEWPADLVLKANSIAAAMGARPIAVSEPRYSLLYRNHESDLFPVARREGIGNVVFSSLAHGMLTGKYKPGEEAPAGTRAAGDDTNQVMKQMYWTEENKRKTQEFAEIARADGITPAQLAIAWCLLNPAVTSVIGAATKISQLEDNLKAVDIKINPETVTKLDKLFPAPDKS